MSAPIDGGAGCELSLVAGVAVSWANAEKVPPRMKTSAKTAASKRAGAVCAMDGDWNTMVQAPSNKTKGQIADQRESAARQAGRSAPHVSAPRFGMCRGLVIP